MNGRRGRAGRIAVLPAIVAGFALVLRPLAAFWGSDTNYAFGWGVPFLAAYLFIERWRTRPRPAAVTVVSRPALAAILAVWTAVFLFLRLLIETEPASRPLLWLDACLQAGAMLALVALLGGRAWLRHFAFPILFLLAGVPWIFRFEWLITQGLMRLNAETVSDTLALAGIPARAAGNTIFLTTGQLGVTTACSGIRSLQAALMMALFFGEFYRFGGRGRFLLLSAGAGVALTANYARMLYLAWRGAREGVAAVPTAHDSTGLVVMAVTLLALWALAGTFRPCTVTLRPCAQPPGVSAARLAATWATGVLFAIFFSETVTQSWYTWRELAAPRHPTWDVVWPTHAPSFHPLPLSPDALSELHPLAANAAAWRDSAGWDWTGVWIHYRSGAAGKVVFESHNPALCLPAAGWTLEPGGDCFGIDLGPVHLAVQGRVFRSASRQAFVFWVPYRDRGAPARADQKPGDYGHTLSVLAHGRLPLLQDVWNGVRGAEAETLEIALTGSGAYSDAERSFRSEIPRLIRTGRPAAITTLPGRH